MGGYHSFYQGSNYKMKDNFENPYGSHFSASSFGMAVDPRTANQIKATTSMINTGAKAVEVQMTFAETAKAIPKQHLEEINRLRKLTGVELTLHGPMIEPSGVTENRWDEMSRVHAEKEITEAIVRGNKIRPDGKLVVTMHTSHSLPPTEITEMVDGKPKLIGLSLVNERTGQIATIPKPRKDFFENNEKEPTPKDYLDEINRSQWQDGLSTIALNVQRARNEIDQLNNVLPDGKSLIDVYKEYAKDPVAFTNEMERMGKTDKESYEIAERIKRYNEELSYAGNFLRDAYGNFKEYFNMAYEAGDDQIKDNLNRFSKEIAPKIKQYKEDPEKIIEFSEQMARGVAMLNSLEKERIKIFKPLKDFAIEKSAETFSNVALNAYKEYKNNAPILSLENPPAGSGIYRGDEIKQLVEATRKRLAEKLEKEKLLSPENAAKKAEALIGVTWDVGHINMLRKYGYSEKDLQKETEAVASMVNKIHLSDNFGFEHSELPMGMGNVPMKEHLAELKKAHGDKLDEIKKIVETGDWYQHFGQQMGPPLIETFQAFGSPVYGMKMAPYWNSTAGNTGGYFTGLGLNPDIHHSIYGSGFSSIPVELGGQMQGRNRLSGAPME